MKNIYFLLNEHLLKQQKTFDINEPNITNDIITESLNDYTSFLTTDNQNSIQNDKIKIAYSVYLLSYSIYTNPDTTNRILFANQNALTHDEISFIKINSCLISIYLLLEENSFSNEEIKNQIYPQIQTYLNYIQLYCANTKIFDFTNIFNGHTNKAIFNSHIKPCIQLILDISVHFISFIDEHNMTIFSKNYFNSTSPHIKLLSTIHKNNILLPMVLNHFTKVFKKINDSLFTPTNEDEIIAFNQFFSIKTLSHIAKLQYILKEYCSNITLPETTIFLKLLYELDTFNEKLYNLSSNIEIAKELSIFSNMKIDLSDNNLQFNLYNNLILNHKLLESNLLLFMIIDIINDTNKTLNAQKKINFLIELFNIANIKYKNILKEKISNKILFFTKETHAVQPRELNKTFKTSQTLEYLVNNQNKEIISDDDELSNINDMQDLLELSCHASCLLSEKLQKINSDQNSIEEDLIEIEKILKVINIVGFYSFIESSTTYIIPINQLIELFTKHKLDIKLIESALLYAPKILIHTMFHTISIEAENTLILKLLISASSIQDISAKKLLLACDIINDEDFFIKIKQTLIDLKLHDNEKYDKKNPQINSEMTMQTYIANDEIQNNSLNDDVDNVIQEGFLGVRDFIRNQETPIGESISMSVYRKNLPIILNNNEKSIDYKQLIILYLNIENISNYNLKKIYFPYLNHVSFENVMFFIKNITLTQKDCSVIYNKINLPNLVELNVFILNHYVNPDFMYYAINQLIQQDNTKLTLAKLFNNYLNSINIDSINVIKNLLTKYTKYSEFLKDEQVKDFLCKYKNINPYLKSYYSDNIIDIDQNILLRTILSGLKFFENTDITDQEQFVQYAKLLILYKDYAHMKNINITNTDIFKIFEDERYKDHKITTIYNLLTEILKAKDPISFFMEITNTPSRSTPTSTIKHIFKNASNLKLFLRFESIKYSLTELVFKHISQYLQNSNNTNMQIIIKELYRLNKVLIKYDITSENTPKLINTELELIKKYKINNIQIFQSIYDLKLCYTQINQYIIPFKTNVEVSSMQDCTIVPIQYYLEKYKTPAINDIINFKYPILDDQFTEFLYFTCDNYKNTDRIKITLQLYKNNQLFPSETISSELMNAFVNMISSIEQQRIMKNKFILLNTCFKLYSKSNNISSIQTSILLNTFNSLDLNDFTNEEKELLLKISKIAHNKFHRSLTILLSCLPILIKTQDANLKQSLLKNSSFLLYDKSKMNLLPPIKKLIKKNILNELDKKIYEKHHDEIISLDYFDVVDPDAELIFLLKNLKLNNEIPNLGDIQNLYEKYIRLQFSFTFYWHNIKTFYLLDVLGIQNTSCVKLNNTYSINLDKTLQMKYIENTYWYNHFYSKEFFFYCYKLYINPQYKERIKDYLSQIKLTKNILTLIQEGLEHVERYVSILHYAHESLESFLEFIDKLAIQQLGIKYNRIDGSNDFAILYKITCSYEYFLKTSTHQDYLSKKPLLSQLHNTIKSDTLLEQLARNTMNDLLDYKLNITNTTLDNYLKSINYMFCLLNDIRQFIFFLHTTIQNQFCQHISNQLDKQVDSEDLKTDILKINYFLIYYSINSYNILPLIQLEKALYPDDYELMQSINILKSILNQTYENNINN